MNNLSDVINLSLNPISDHDFQVQCKADLDLNGALVLPNFFSAAAIQQVKTEGEAKQDLAWFCKNRHNVFLTPPDSEFSMEHPRNREVDSSKGCITDDQVSADSALRTLYDSPAFKAFLCYVLGEEALYKYADDLSSINVHFASEGQELGWHFDNSSFAITLMIQQPKAGGAFEYVKNVRDADYGEMNVEVVDQVLNGDVAVSSLEIEEGSLALFRGRNSMHRVTPTEGDTTRMLVVLAYNGQPGVELSESARMTFYGRLD